MKRHKHRGVYTLSKQWPIALAVVLAISAVIGGLYWYVHMMQHKNLGFTTMKKTADDVRRNPLHGRTFYVDPTRQITQTAQLYHNQGNEADALLLDRIAAQPGTTWLIGPSNEDPTAAHDIAEVNRTSSEAAAQGTVPIYELYAIPDRDACANYSKSGFKSKREYLAWIEAILGALKTDAVFSVEADAVGHTIDSCMSPQQAMSRYELLRETMTRLHKSPHVLAAYLDAGHSEWFPDPKKLVKALKASGVDQARGVAVNVSYYEDTPRISEWAQRLAQELGGDKGVLIDTSRNGRGSAPAEVKGEARWCNTPGRAIGPPPTSNVPDKYIDGYAWIKIAGESDGACFGNPPAGVFMPSLALELARNAAL